MVEQEAVNFEVVSSSLTGGAIFLYNEIMILKLFFAMADGLDNKAHNISVLLDSNNELFFAENKKEALEKFKALFNGTLQTGAIGYEDNNETILYAHCSLYSIPEGWSYVPFDQLNDKNCSDYGKMRPMIKNLGYETD